MRLTDNQRITLGELAEELIPPSPGFISADEAGVATIFIDRVLAARMDMSGAFIALLEEAEKDPRGFIWRVQAQESKRFELLTFFIGGAYFMSPRVRAWLGYEGQVGEFQDGAPQPEYGPDGILAQVLDRGPIYRSTPDP